MVVWNLVHLGDLFSNIQILICGFRAKIEYICHIHIRSVVYSGTPLERPGMSH